MAKKLLAMMLVLVMACSFVAFAEEAVGDGTTTETQGDVMLISAAPVDTTPRVVLEATEPDADGYFTMSLTAHNFEFMVMQAYVTYNSEAVVPVNAETKKETEVFDEFAKIPVVAEKDGKEITDVFTTTWTQILKDKAAFSFSLFGNMSEYPNSVVNENKRIVANEKGLELYRFAFKKISDKDADFKVYNSTRSQEPDGVKISNIVDEKVTIKTVVVLPESVSKIAVPETAYEVTPTIVTSDDSKDNAQPMDERVKRRSQNVIFLQIGNYGTVSDSRLKWVDKDNKNVKPYIKDSRTMVPLRFIAEELGAKVGYDDATRAITITLGKTVMGLTVDQKAYTLNGEAFEMDCAAEIVENRTFVPVRFVTEALGKSVEWLEGQRMVIITNKNYPWDKENGVEKSLLSEIMLMLTLRDFAY